MLPLTLALRNPRQTVAFATGAAALLAFTAYQLLRRRPTPDQVEARRREHLALHGRIHDATLLDAAPTLTNPDVLIYQYSIAGVTYECAQNVSALPTPPQNLAPDLPIQVRYNRENPGDSIVIAESWTGLWSLKHQP